MYRGGLLENGVGRSHVLYIAILSNDSLEAGPGRTCCFAVTLVDKFPGHFACVGGSMLTNVSSIVINCLVESHRLAPVPECAPLLSTVLAQLETSTY